MTDDEYVIYRTEVKKRLQPVRDFLRLIEAYGYLPMTDLEAKDGVEWANAMAYQAAVRAIESIESNPLMPCQGGVAKKYKNPMPPPRPPADLVQSKHDKIHKDKHGKDRRSE